VDNFLSRIPETAWLCLVLFYGIWWIGTKLEDVTAAINRLADSREPDNVDI
jgi:hypothetical protein